MTAATHRRAALPTIAGATAAKPRRIEGHRPDLIYCLRGHADDHQAVPDSRLPARPGRTAAPHNPNEGRTDLMKSHICIVCGFERAGVR
jgi:hypothetical protein